MSDQTAFIEGINASPEDNEPRLVYADWLEEHGQDRRAEFIRLQIERSALPFWDARQFPLLARENELLGLYGLDWRKELPTLEGVAWGDFRRGFVASASFSDFRVFKANASRSWAATPLEAITVGDWPEDAIDRLEPVVGLRELSINQTVFHERPLRNLADAPLLSTLRTLNLGHCALGANGLREVLFSPYLKNLTSLRLPFNSIGGPGVDVLLGTESLPSLIELDLSEQDSYARYEEDPVIKAADMELLVGWSVMEQLESLTLAGNEVGAEGLRFLTQSSNTSNLKSLSLRANGLRSDAIQAFMETDNVMQLEVLDLGHNMIGDAGVGLLAKAECLDPLKVLSLDRCEMTETGAQDLCRAPFVHQLRRLNVNENGIAAAGVEAILAAEPAELHTLRIGFNDVGIDGVVELAQSPVSSRFLALDLSYNGLDDDAMKVLIESPNFEKLRVLQISRNSFTGPAIASLSRSALWKQLVVFDAVEPGDPAIPFELED